jgi:hypothetical protein
MTEPQPDTILGQSDFAFVVVRHDACQELSYAFPGLRLNRPMASATLQARLRELGVPSARIARNGAWLSLVGLVHWKMLADLLGVADTTANAWHRENSGDRASYVASRLRHSQRTAGPE